MALRKQLNAQLEEEGLKLSVNDFVMKACAVALRNHPNLNASTPPAASSCTRRWTWPWRSPWTRAS